MANDGANAGIREILSFSNGSAPPAEVVKSSPFKGAAPGSPADLTAKRRAAERTEKSAAYEASSGQIAHRELLAKLAAEHQLAREAGQCITPQPPVVHATVSQEKEIYLRQVEYDFDSSLAAQTALGHSCNIYEGRADIVPIDSGKYTLKIAILSGLDRELPWELAKKELAVKTSALEALLGKPERISDYTIPEYLRALANRTNQTVVEFLYVNAKQQLCSRDILLSPDESAQTRALQEAADPDHGIYAFRTVKICNGIRNPADPVTYFGAYRSRLEYLAVATGTHWASAQNIPGNVQHICVLTPNGLPVISPLRPTDRVINFKGEQLFP